MPRGSRITKAYLAIFFLKIFFSVCVEWSGLPIIVDGIPGGPRSYNKEWRRGIQHNSRSCFFGVTEKILKLSGFVGLEERPYKGSLGHGFPLSAFPRFHLCSPLFYTEGPPNN